MHLLALASDYDGTLAENGRVSETTHAALRRLKESGRKLILISGRELEDLTRVFEDLALFDLLVIENGALLYNPSTKRSRLLCEPPPPAFAAALRAAGVHPLSCGKAIVATWHPNEDIVLEVIRRMGLDLQVIFNKGAVMVLPAGVNKASGLVAALDELALSRQNLVGIGDAENDLAFLKMCECSVAVANALPAVKQSADLVTAHDHGAGVEEVVEWMLSEQREDRREALAHREVPLGLTIEGDEIGFPAVGVDSLFAGYSGAGKSTIVTGLVQRLARSGYQFCLIDPEGDYESLDKAVVLGTEEHAPSLDEAIGILEKPAQNLVVNLLGVGLDDRPAFFADLMLRIQELRLHYGRPHRIVIDEAHHVLPATRARGESRSLPPAPAGIIMITVDPSQLDLAALRLVKMLIVVGKTAPETLRQFCSALKIAAPDVNATETLNDDEALLWTIGTAPMRIKPLLGQRESRRHRRKYATGEIGADHSFYFRGAEQKLNLRAQNLQAFVRLAEGLDDDTWTFHLQRGDYSRWFRDVIKDPELAQETENVEHDSSISPRTSRELIRSAIEKRYTAGTDN